MKINITVKNFELTPSIKEYIEKKMSVLDKLITKWVETGSAEINFDAGRTTKHHHKGMIYYAEANLQVPGKMIRAKRTSDDLHAAIDATRDILAEELKEYKGKLKAKNLKNLKS